MEFTSPYYLLLLLLIVPVIYIFRKTEASLSKTRLYASLVFRVLLVVFSAAALADMRLSSDSTTLTAVFLIDRSKSAALDEQNWGRTVDFVNSSIKHKPQGDNAAVVVFGRDAAVEMPLSDKPSELKDIRSRIDSDFTNISDALRTASGLLPEYGIRRIILVSDGNETSGNAVREAKTLSSAGIEISTVPVVSSVKNEVMVNYVNAPSKAAKYQPFDLKIGISSLQYTTAKIYVYRDNEMIITDNIELQKGENSMKFRDRLSEGGIHEYKVVIDPSSDTLNANNTAYTFCKVKAEPKILLCEGGEGQYTYLSEALRNAGISIDVVDRNNFPFNPNDVIKYDAVILSDVDSASIDNYQNKFLYSYVKDMGGGFVMIGGPDSFGAGGYIDTPVDDMLPVGCEVKKKHTLADVAIVIVLDQSGSMSCTVDGGQTKMELANQAAAAVTDVLTEMDSVGVLAVDEAPKWVAELQKLQDKESVKKKILSNRPGGGGIYVFSGLTAAADALKKSTASIRHILLFADGADSEQKEGSPELVDELLKKFSITTTTISIGIGCDTLWLKKLAETGKGRFYVTEDANELPRIFLWETFISSKSAFIEKKFLPHAIYFPEMLKGIDWAKPAPLHGYNVTTPKETAEILIEALESDPLLARWQFGLGRSVAFTSDAKARWGSDWVGWDGYSVFWPQVVRWVMRNLNEEGLQTSISLDGSKGMITAELRDKENKPVNFANLNAVVSCPNAPSIPVRLRQTGMGVYEGEFELSGYGNYYLTVNEDEKSVLGTYAKAISYPLEFRKIDTDEELLGDIAESSGGSYKILPEHVFLHNSEGKPKYSRLWQLLLALALLSLLLDVAARRMVFPSETIRKIAYAIRKSGDHPVESETELKDNTPSYLEGSGDGTAYSTENKPDITAGPTDDVKQEAGNKTVAKPGDNAKAVKKELPESTTTMKRLLEMKDMLRKKK